MEAFNGLESPNYFSCGPFRFVRAYEHCFRTHAKGRWVGNNILDVLEKEFKAYTRAYYKNAIEEERIQVNGKPQAITYKFKNNDLFEHKTTRVEPPILDLTPKVLFEDEKVVVVSKPPYLSVHASGGFLFNSLVGLLRYELKYAQELHVLHRLDKLTAGVMILGKDRDFSKKFHESDEIKKTYLARVHGDFAHDFLEYEKPIYCISKKEGQYAVFHSTDLAEMNAAGAKQSKTLFKKLWYDPVTDTSLLECNPITGRTHQIRVHISSLGHSILNDTLYGGKFVGNRIISQRFPHLEEISSKITSDDLKIDPVEKDTSSNIEDKNLTDSEVEAELQKKLKNNSEKAVVIHPVNLLLLGIPEKKLPNGIQLIEPEKGVYRLEGNFIENHQWSYQTQPMEICLHSIKYVFEEYTFEDEKPYWADQSYIQFPFLESKL